MSENITTSTETTQKEPKSIKKTYYIKGVQFDNVHDYIGIRKHQSDFSVDTFIQQSAALECKYAHTADEIKKLWAETPEMTPQEAFEKFSSNAQQLMTVLSIMGPEKTLKALKSSIHDQQTIVKTQKRTFVKDPSNLNFGQTKIENSPSLKSDLFETKEVTYNDTYTLHKIPKEQFGERSGIEDDILVLEDDILVLEVECPSTHQHYFIFVDGNEPQCQDAIGAVAWTMVKDDGNCLTKEEYMLLQSEA